VPEAVGQTAGVTWSDLDGPTALVTYAPEPAAWLDRALAAGALPAAAAVPGRVLGLTPLVPETPQHPLITSFAEQFAVDVAQVDDLMRAELAHAAGDRMFPIVLAVWLGDWVPRVRSALDRLFIPGEWAMPPADDGDRWTAMDELQRSIARLDAVDPVTSELVRLRGARQHECRLCQSLRSRSALAAGADESTFDAVDDHAGSDLSDAQKAALDLTDSLIWDPGAVPARGVREHFGPEQAVELVLDVARNAQNKIAVALAADDPHVTEGVEVYDINPDGTLTYGLTAP
jgi:alkylhydroperoxidase family enzyme